MASRTPAPELERSAIAALEAALSAVDVPSQSAGRSADLVIVTPDGVRLAIVLKAASRVNELQARRYLGTRHEDILPVVVADEITLEAQRELRRAGIGFLDRRGHLFLRSDALHLDVDVAPDPRLARSSTVRQPIRGRSGITVACALLLDADEVVGVRELARRTGLPVSTTSKALAPMRDAALVHDGQALTPDLFWALAEVWSPARVALAERPAAGTGVLSGTVAAAELGAPVAAAADSPPDLYVVGEAEVRALERRHGVTSGPSRKASVAVQPTHLVAETAVDNRAHPLFVALDLAQDRARGREILDGWHPKEFRRVW